MLTKEQREEIRKCIVDAAKYGDSAPANVFGGGSKFTLDDVSHLLAAMDKAEEEIERLRVLVGKLHKILNLASLTNCDHKCFTKETQSHLLALLDEAHAVAEHRETLTGVHVADLDEQ